MTNPETPSTDQAGGPSLDDVYKLCEEFEFHFEGDTDESLKTLHGMINTTLTRWGWRSSAALEANSRATELQRLLALLVDFLCLSGYGVSPEAWRQVCLLSGRHCEPFLSKSLKVQPSTKKPNPSDKEIDLLWDDVGVYYELYTQARALVRAALGKWGVSTTNSAIRAALERLIKLDKGIESIGGVPMDDWTDAIATADAALNAEPEECPVKKHCAEMLQLWDAECEMDNAMEHLRGLLSDSKQSTEIQP